MWLRVAAGFLALVCLAPGVASARSCGSASIQVSVLDETGAAMDGLGADDFRVTMRGDLLHAQSMSHGVIPHSTLVLVDRSASMGQNGKIEAGRQIGLTLAGLTPGVSQFASFAGDVSTLSDARGTLGSATLQAGTDPAHEIYDAIAASMRGMTLHAGDYVFVVTDSSDSGSRTTGRELQDLFAATGARLFFLVLPGNAMTGEMEQIANATGGTVFRPITSGDGALRADEAIRNTTNWHGNIANVYSIEFQEDRPGEKVLPLKVSVEKRKLKSGYFLAPSFIAPCTAVAQ